MIRGVVEKNGSFYRRFKVKIDGRWRDQYVKLPHPSHPDFSAELARINAPKQKRQGFEHGTMGALAVLYSARLHKDKLADTTLRNKLYYVKLIAEQHGHRTVAGLRPSHIYTLRDGMADTPGKANNFLAVLKDMMQFATERDWRSDNPAVNVSLLPIGEHQPWPAEVQEAALAAASPMLRLAIIMGLCSGQRVSDVIRMQHGWHKGGMMQLTQQKTKVLVAIPMHQLWIEELAKVERRSVTILYDRFGRPFSGADRIQEQLRRLMKQIGHVGFTYHGLRKNACCYLLELGLSDTEVGAILGMTPETVRHYGKQARALIIARGASERVLCGKPISPMGETVKIGRAKS
jgi:integrase